MDLVATVVCSKSVTTFTCVAMRYQSDKGGAWSPGGYNGLLHLFVKVRYCMVT